MPGGKEIESAAEEGLRGQRGGGIGSSNAWREGDSEGSHGIGGQRREGECGEQFLDGASSF